MTDTVKVSVPVNYATWNVPRYAVLVDSNDSNRTLSCPIDKVDINVIHSLAGKWLDQLYASLGKSSPWRRI